jgi:hypothetical protein
MAEPLDELYLQWLNDQVSSRRTKNPKFTHWRFLRQLYTKEFVWLVPNDDNRVEDGRDLRSEFMDQTDVDYVHEWMLLGCSVLEMMVGLSRRLAFEAEGRPRDWFWIMVTNLDLGNVSDASEDHTREIDLKLDKLIWRTYEPNGQGGLFPLTHPEKDQRDVEIWYQLNAYLLELEPS